MRARKELLATCGLFLLAALCVNGFYHLSEAYDGFRIPYGGGAARIAKNEQIFYLWYVLFGCGALIALSAGLLRTRLPDRIESLFRRGLAGPRLFLLCGALLLFGSVLAFRFLVLQGAPVADDESVYVFVARTLLQGRVVNPLPEDAGFFRNQFLVLNDAGWFGKYPVGHPLVLALGEAVGLRLLVPAAITVLVFLLTFAVGRRLFGEKEALLGCALLLVSPQFVFTGATELSQPTSCLCMMCGLLAMLEISENARYRWYLLAGAAWGYGVLVRPLPGVLFLLAAVAVYLIQEPWQRWRVEPASRAARILAAAVPLLACAGLFLWVNRQQTGSALHSGYVYEYPNPRIVTEGVRIWFSLAGAFLRQNFWLFGWPVSFLFVFFARGRVSLALFWSLLGAEYAYRVLVPKTVVATTGPIYVAEIVPLLALATASGAVRVKRRLEAVGLEMAKRRMAALLVASILVAAAMFLPVQVASIGKSSRAWLTPYRLLAAHGAGRALVFASIMVPPNQGLSWAYYPPNPSPAFDDDVVFVRMPGGDSLRPMVNFWQKRFPGRTAWVFDYREGKPWLAQIKASPADGATYYHLDVEPAAER